MNHRPKKSLGQNFLKSDAALAKIRDAADLVGNDVVLEIGPGLGALTEILVKFAGKVVAVEKDDLLFQELRMKFADTISEGRLDVIHGDIMDFDTEVLRGYDEGLLVAYKLVANIPYNLTGAIIEKFLSTPFQPSTMVVLVQKEVAERIVAIDRKTGKPAKESILSIAVKVYGNPFYITTVKAGSFVPAPKVDSAVIAIRDISRSHFPSNHHEQVFFQIVKSGFAHKRKTLAGNLKGVWEPVVVDGALAAAGLIPTVRAEDVTVAQWLVMMNYVYDQTYR